ncbi:hypothetical protein AMTR_s00046p00214930 [Amborella trichopoda]|uniref:Pentacotripeptide-repeat region of PRORP domain-containing protein n=1 Tax=Amborella trichopoda TaxID=13333 RepID=U5D773_AMBTC|nr:hypothetical protein AMTR_s00046p00214930 [Amborella trichopoda]
MASLPCPVFANNILAAEPGLRNGASYLPSPEKAAASLSYQRYPTTTTVMEKTTSFQQLHFSEALSILCEDHKVDSSIYAALLQECIRKKSLSDAQAVQAHMIKSGFHEHVFLSTFLVNVYSKCGHTDHARKVFDSMSRRNIVSWTSLMTGYAHNSQFEQAVNLFCELLEIGCYPTNYTFGAVLSACTSLGYLDFGKQIHGYILKYKIGSDTSIGNALCSLYSKSGDVKSAQKIFEGIPDKNVISWTTIISSAVDNGESELGLRLFVEMLMAAVEPNDFTLTSVLSACCVILDLGLAKQIHSFSIKTGLESNLPVTNSVMYTYLKCSRLEEARHLFNSMETMSLITWNAMIAGHAQLMDLSSDGLEANSNGVEALKIYLKLNRSTMKPDLYSFSSILSIST